MAQIEALETRRDIEIRHARFNAGLITSAIFNTHRSADTEPISAFDFVTGVDFDPEAEAKQEERRSTRRAIGMAFTTLAGRPAEEIQAEKARMVLRMTENGVEDPEGLIREVFPDL